jgi:hypothetical protein
MRTGGTLDTAPDTCLNIRLDARKQRILSAIRIMLFRCTFSGKLWKFGGEASWWFISIPLEDSEDLERFCRHRKRNFGSIRVSATLGQTTWSTSVFRDSQANAYLLPIKLEVRRKEALMENHLYEVTLCVE